MTTRRMSSPHRGRVVLLSLAVALATLAGVFLSRQPLRSADDTKPAAKLVVRPGDHVSFIGNTLLDTLLSPAGAGGDAGGQPVPGPMGQPGAPMGGMMGGPGDAQNAPTPYAVFAVIYDGRLLADHQISRARFRNIMNKLRP